MKKELCFVLIGWILAFNAYSQEGEEMPPSPGWVNVIGRDSGESDAPPTERLTGNFGAMTMAAGTAGGSGPIAEVITPEIAELARGLENDPKRIFDFVHDSIRHVLYFGSKKGAQMTLLERSGNDFDQCALLVALLQAAGHTNVGYQFGLLQMPYEAASHYDIKHWLQLSLVNTNWQATTNYLGTLLAIRGYPNGAFIALTDANTVAFHRVWVRLQTGGATYYLDPAFKIHEFTSGMDLGSAIGVSSNDLWTAAGGTSTADYVQNLNETAVRDKLTMGTTNLLAWLSNNSPNASVEEVLGGWRVISSEPDPLPGQVLFSEYTKNGAWPVVDWTWQPTELMTLMRLTLGGTNWQWWIPELRARRLVLRFPGTNVAQVWLDDEQILEKTVAGADRQTVVVRFDHPFGDWRTDNTLNNRSTYDESPYTTYLRKHSTYALIYSFEPSTPWLRYCQERLEAYRARGLDDSSREVTSETLQVMAAHWLVHVEQVQSLHTAPLGLLWQNHHRVGRMAQEEGLGYYIDVYNQMNGTLADAPETSGNQGRLRKGFDLRGYWGSAFEHGLIEQLQSGDLLGASTIRVLQKASAAGIKVYLAGTNNWTSGYNVKSHLINYESTDLSEWEGEMASKAAMFLMPADGKIAIAGDGSWRGHGVVKRADSPLEYTMSMLIEGGYNGGYSAFPDVYPNPPFIAGYGTFQPVLNLTQPFTIPALSFSDPVNVADGTFKVEATDFTLGQAEPRGLSFSRHYSSAERNRNKCGLGAGWTHNYNFECAKVSAPMTGLGGSTPAQMAPMLVALRAGLDFYSTNANPKNWLLTALIAKWGLDQLTDNGVSVVLGAQSLQFVKQPDGSYTPPAGATQTLTKNSSGVYRLNERHGRTFKFNHNGLLTNIVDQLGKGMTFTYGGGPDNDWVTETRDWKDRTFTFTYGGNPSKLTTVTDSTGRTLRFGYTNGATGLPDLEYAVDPESKTNWYQYDTNHQIICQRNGLGRLVTTNEYGLGGRVTRQWSEGNSVKEWRVYWAESQSVEEDPTGSKRRFGYDDRRRLVWARDALGNESRTVYDGQDHAVLTVSPGGQTNRFMFDGNQNLLWSVDPLGYTNRFFYDGLFNLVRTEDALGRTSRFGYNDKFQMTGSTNGAGDWVVFGYNASNGQLLDRTDPGGVTSYAYDSEGYLTRITYPGGLGSEGFLNNTRGDVLSRTNARLVVTSYKYNLRREVTNTVAAGSVTNRVWYDGARNAGGTIDARGFVTSNTWSATRKLLATTLPPTPQGVPVITNEYDSRDWLARTLDPLQRATIYTNDPAGRVIAVTDPLSRTVRSVYDAEGRQLFSTNAANEVTRQEWNGRGELVRTADHANRAVGRAYDAVGNQLRLTNRNGKVWTFQFDGANRLTNTISPLNRETKQGYNNRGLLHTVIEPSSQSASLYYDAKGRLTNRTDGLGGVSYRYDANNNLTNVSEAGRSNSWAFDSLDRVSTYKDAEGNLTQYAYDANGNLTNLVYPGGKAVRYAYDSLNRLTNVTDWANRQTRITYDLASQIRTITRPNGTVREMNYDAAGQATNIIERTASGTPIAFFRYGWNAAARMDWEFAAPLPHSYTLPSRPMTHDDDNRIATFNGQTVVHDLDGNMTSGPGTNDTFASYVYDVRNRLRSVGGIAYGYDPAGNRIAITNGASTTRFVVNPNAALSQVLIRTKADGSKTFYVYGAGLLYEVNETSGGVETGTATYHYDYRGSTVAITSGSGSVADRVEYSPYGTLTYRSGTTDTPFLFNGRYGVQTDANGLLYMRARYYNPHLCRFINSDPAGFSGGINFYAYADGNPVNLMDPYGLCALGESSGASWLITPGGLSGWAADQVLNSFMGTGALLSRVLGGGMELAGMPSDHLFQQAEMLEAGMSPFGRGGYYDPQNPVNQYAMMAAIFLTKRLPCFSAGTKVSTPDGDKEIEDIHIGDTVHAFSFTSGEPVERIVLDTPRHFTYYWVEVQVGDEIIYATRRHLFWVEDQTNWVEAINLQKWMTLRLRDGEVGTIRSVVLRELEQPETTYNLLIDQEHNYFVGQNHVLVHNGYPDFPQYPPATQVGETFQFNFDTSPNMRNSRAVGIDRAIAGGYVSPNDGPFHHINSVQTHPHLAAEPSNIQGATSRANHLNRHGGNWRNPTTGPLMRKPGC